MKERETSSQLGNEASSRPDTPLDKTLHEKSDSGPNIVHEGEKVYEYWDEYTIIANQDMDGYPEYD